MTFRNEEEYDIYMELLDELNKLSQEDEKSS